MWIKSIELVNFRNYTTQKIELSDEINVFYGDNAQGKTNIIESIYLSSLGKSFRTNKDSELIKLGEEFSSVLVNFQKKDREGTVDIKIANKKNILVNKIKINKLSSLLGNVNMVIFNPDDINILKGSPQNRRKFLDIMISQLKPNYINNLSLYNKTIEQRNSYLRQIREERKDEALLEIWDEKLAEYAYVVAKYREDFMEKIKSKIDGIHREITDSKEIIKLEYKTECLDKDEYRKFLKERRKVDIIRGYTTKGIHKDDFEVYINDKALDIYGSQGQHRTAILSLKLSELNIIYDEIGEYPILLLDDFMSELDEKRRKNLLEKIQGIQVIITCTEKISVANKNVLIYNVQDGKASEEI